MLIAMLPIRVLENHAFFENGIDQRIAARDVRNRRVGTARLFQFPQAKQCLQRSLSSLVIGTNKSSPH